MRLSSDHSQFSSIVYNWTTVGHVVKPHYGCPRKRLGQWITTTPGGSQWAACTRNLAVLKTTIPVCITALLLSACLVYGDLCLKLPAIMLRLLGFQRKLYYAHIMLDYAVGFNLWHEPSHLLQIEYGTVAAGSCNPSTQQANNLNLPLCISFWNYNYFTYLKGANAVNRQYREFQFPLNSSSTMRKYQPKLEVIYRSWKKIKGS